MVSGFPPLPTDYERLGLLRLGLLFFFLTEDESFERKLYEQVEIRGVDDTAGHKVGHLVVTQSRGIVISTIEVVVHGGAHDERAYDHLRDLHDGDDPGRKPLRHALHGLHEEVEIHHRVDRVVHRHEIQAWPRARDNTILIAKRQSEYIYATTTNLPRTRSRRHSSSRAAPSRGGTSAERSEASSAAR